MTLLTLWLPITNFNEIEKKINHLEGEMRDSSTFNTTVNRNWKVKTHTKTIEDIEYKLILDSLGFIYIESISPHIDKSVILGYLNSEILNKKTKKLIENTFLKLSILCENHTDFNKFLCDISIEIAVDSIEIEYLKYNIKYDKENIYKNKSKVKFIIKSKNSSDESHFESIINRNFKKLLEKSLFYSHGLKYDKNELYELKSITNIVSIPPEFKLDIFENSENIQSNNTEIILRNIIDKAIQDTIEEKTILEFLEKTQENNLRSIFDKIQSINCSLLKLNSHLLATNKEDKYCIEKKCNSMDSEEDIEVFVQQLFYVIPEFRVIESKIKEAYYIKVGNTTTDSQVNKSETLDNVLFYERWKMAISYFENMSSKIKDTLTLYHQNKSIKELEDISYYENYQSDLDDIKNIKSKEENGYSLSSQTKAYLKHVTMVIGVTALSGEAPLYKVAQIKTKELSNISTELFFNDMTFYIAISNFFEILMNIIIYGAIFYFIFKIPIVKKFFSEAEEEIKEGYYIFNSNDYDKHEHRSHKALMSFNHKNANLERLTIEYNEIMSAYTLMKNLQKKEITSFSSKRFSIFPTLLQSIYNKAYEKKFGYIEDYRISRRDKITTKILLRYKITDLPLKKFLEDFVEKDDFLDVFNKIYNHKNNTSKLYKNINGQLSNEIEKWQDMGDGVYKNRDLSQKFPKYALVEDIKIEEFIKEIKRLVGEEGLNKIKLNFYIVYAFNLKMDDSTINPNFIYNIFKDQFRVHYHTNKLPLKEMEKIQEYLAQIIYIYFLARLKDFSYLETN